MEHYYELLATSVSHFYRVAAVLGVLFCTRVGASYLKEGFSQLASQPIAEIRVYSATAPQADTRALPGRRGVGLAYKLTSATRQQFEAALALRKRTIMPLAPSDTLQRLAKSMVYQYGNPKEKLRYSVLRIKLADNTTKLLTSKPSTFEEETCELAYVGKISALHKYVLNAGYYEGGECLLVDRRTGKVDTLQSIPVGSPTLQRLAALYQGYPYENAPNGVEVFRLVGGKLRKHFTIAQLKWLPEELAWENENAFLLKTLPMAEVLKAEKLNRQLTPAEMKRQNYSYLRVSILK